MKKTLSLILALVLAFSVVSFAGAASYNPAKTSGLKAVYSSTTCIRLKWSAVKNATGYKVYKYIDSSKKYVALATVKGSTEKLITGLKSSTSYKFAVRAYRTVKSSNYYGKYSDKLKVSTISIKKSDEELLTYMLTSMDFSGSYNYKKSSYKSLKWFLGTGPLYGNVMNLFYHLGWEKYLVQYDMYTYKGNKCVKLKNVNDPLGTIAKNDDYLIFFKAKASKMDWIIKNVFNKTPSHKKSVVNSLWKDAYYYEGYYYLPSTICGEEGLLDCKIVSKKINSNGVYTIKYKITELGFDYGTYKLTACLKKIDGKRIWSIYTIN